MESDKKEPPKKKKEPPKKKKESLKKKTKRFIKISTDKPEEEIVDENKYSIKLNKLICKIKDQYHIQPDQTIRFGWKSV